MSTDSTFPASLAHPFPQPTPVWLQRLLPNWFWVCCPDWHWCRDRLLLRPNCNWCRCCQRPSRRSFGRRWFRHCDDVNQRRVMTPEPNTRGRTPHDCALVRTATSNENLSGGRLNMLRCYVYAWQLRSDMGLNDLMFERGGVMSQYMVTDSMAYTLIITLPESIPPTFVLVHFHSVFTSH